jgi:hypothetical protein
MEGPEPWRGSWSPECVFYVQLWLGYNLVLSLANLTRDWLCVVNSP